MNKAIELDSSNDDAYVLRGYAYTCLGDIQQGMSDYNKAIELKPNNPSPYYFRARSFFEQKKYRLAIDEFNTALKLNPSMKSIIYCHIGSAYLALEDYNNAIYNFTKSINLSDKLAAAYYGRGYCYEKIDKLELAKSDLSRAKELGYEE